MGKVIRVAVPKLGDWCSIFVLTGEASAPDIEIAHTDPSKEALVAALHERFRYDPDSSIGIARVIRTRESQLYDHLDELLLPAQDDADDALEVVRSLGLRSAMEVPLVKRDRVVGALQFARTVDSPPYTQDDLLLAQLLANRVAATLENRRLDEEQRSIPRTLQASLLPARVPSIDGLDVAVRYWAAGEANIVGGDFYDVFALGDRWAFVIGDACGKGPQAASLTALARHTIRAAAWNGAEPGRVLRHLNHAIEQSDADTFCTVLYTTVTKSATGFDFAVTAGGHPLPIVHRAHGQTEPIGVPGLIVGAFDDVVWTTTSTDLSPGDTVVLYTDGVTDVAPSRGRSIGDMAALVRRACAGTRGADEVARGLANTSARPCDSRIATTTSRSS